MDLIIDKLLSDAGILLSELWQALWHKSPSASQAEPLPPKIEPGSSGTTHPTV